MPIFEIKKPDDVEIDQERLTGALMVAPDTKISGGIYVSRKPNGSIILNVGTENPDAVRTAIRRLFPEGGGFVITELPTLEFLDFQRPDYTGPSQREIEDMLVARGV